ncbi:MAG: endonuclease [Paludibacteraceae bacterium]|nr:endonuclease [Paludibacteraceae bacterium]
MKKHTLLTFCAVLVALGASARPSATHYTQINGKSGVNLWKAVYACTQQGYSDLGYDGLLTAYKKTDVDENGQLIDMYGGCRFAFSNSCGNYKNECDCYNREHSIPKSWWGSSPKTSKQGSDIFHVVPTDGKVNGIRSSLPFGETTNFDYTYNGNKKGTSSFSGYSGTVFEPRDEYKGDFARGYFGTMAKWELKATSSAGSAIFTGDYTANGNFGLTQYGMNLLLKWHRQDPVSDKELRRNDSIEATQGNRNPFIDYPELAEYIWGNKKGQTVSLSTLVCAYEGQQPPVVTPYISSPENGAQMQMSACAGETATLTLNVKGGNLSTNTLLTVSSSDSAIFSISPSFLTPEQVAAGHDVAIIFSPAEEGNSRATITISNDSLNTITLLVSATATTCQTDTTTQPVPEGDYYLLQAEPADWNGIYLIVSEDYGYYLNASIADDASKIASASNKTKVSISNNIIAATPTIDAAAVNIDAGTVLGTYSMRSSTGHYIGISTNSNTLSSSTDKLDISLRMSGGDAVISGTGSLSSRTLRYNNSSGMFRFYTSGQQPVQLYKKTVKQTPSALADTKDSSLSYSDGTLIFRSQVPAHLQIIDIYGRSVFSCTTDRISRPLPAGAYIVLVDGRPHKLVCR